MSTRYIQVTKKGIVDHDVGRGRVANTVFDFDADVVTSITASSISTTAIRNAPLIEVIEGGPTFDTGTPWSEIESHISRQDLTFGADVGRDERAHLSPDRALLGV